MDRKLHERGAVAMRWLLYAVLIFGAVYVPYHLANIGPRNPAGSYQGLHP